MMQLARYFWFKGANIVISTHSNAQVTMIERRGNAVEIRPSVEAFIAMTRFRQPQAPSTLANYTIADVIDPLPLEKCTI